MGKVTKNKWETMGVTFELFYCKLIHWKCIIDREKCRGKEWNWEELWGIKLGFVTLNTFFRFQCQTCILIFLKLSLRWTTCWWSNKTNLRSLKLKFHFSIGKIKIDFQKLIIQLCWILESTFYFLFLLK